MERHALVQLDHGTKCFGEAVKSES